MTTVRDVCAEARFGLSVAAGESLLDRTVRWATVTELVDPSPFLEGGEIILTTGVRLRTTKDQERFVRCTSR
ncbi:MAG: PucR family transcriptional regulator ligand-binding domain-containing protein, partial [Nocardioidaceae bacterium]